MTFRMFSRRWLTCMALLSLSGVAISQAIDRLSTPQIESALEQCGFVQELNHFKKTTAAPPSGLAQQVFAALFPYGPAVNALLATLYISGPPNFLLALCPPNIQPSSLSVMVAFAVGGLLGDTIFHLLPEIFLGEAAPDQAKFVLVDVNKNLLLGVAIIVGFITFTAMDKTLRIATGGAGHEHDHGKQKEELPAAQRGTSTGASASGVQWKTENSSARARKTQSDAPRELEIHSEIPALRLPNDHLRKLWHYNEPNRANRWLSEVLEEDENAGVTQIAIWKAYEAAFKANKDIPMLEATVLIHNASKVFEKASAQIIDGTEKKFIIKGVRPASIPKEGAQVVKAAPQALENLKPEVPSSQPSQSIRLSAYLNLIADFTHNITDGLAISSSFYASPTLGATTTVAVFFHEIPHEVGDFALLIQSGFSKKKAMGAQFVTALGAFLGTTIGITIQEFSKSDNAASKKLSHGDQDTGLFGTGLGYGDMLLPFTAGTFLYVATVAVVPELLETGHKKVEEVKKALYQFLAFLLGAGIMLAISWT